MIRNSRCKSVVSSAVMLAVTLVLTSVQTHAQVVKPFKITGEGVGPIGLPLPTQDPRLHTIEGTATHLGRHTGEGTVQTDSAVFNPATGTIVGEFGSGEAFVFTGANGEKLVCWYGRTEHGASKPGTFVLTIVDSLDDGTPVVEAAWVAEFVPESDKCSGKFAGVTGSWIMYAYSEPFVLGSSDPVHYSWHGDGSLTFEKGK